MGAAGASPRDRDAEGRAAADAEARSDVPNHVRQKLTVVGTKEDVEAFVVTARGARPMTGDRAVDANGHENCNYHPRLTIEPLCFHLIAPVKDRFSKYPYGSEGSIGYEAEVEAWGVKWGPYDVDPASPALTDDGTRVTYEFTCAWGPPVKALTRASLRYRSLRFYLSWGGEGPCRGRHAFEAGKTTIKRSDDYERDIETELPTDAEYEADEDAALAKSDAAERKYIATHDAWVQEQLSLPMLTEQPDV